MYNKITIETQSSESAEFQDFTNKIKKSILFESVSSQGVSFHLEPLQTISVADFSVPISVVGSELELTTETSDEYRLTLDTGHFNTPIDVGLISSSSVSVTPNGNLFSVYCADFDLSTLSAGDLFIFHKDDLSPFSLQSQGTVFMVTGVDAADKKVYAQNTVGVAPETVTMTNLSQLTFFKNEITSSHVIKLNTSFHEQSKGTYGILLATDKYLIIKSEKPLIEDTTSLASSSISIFSQVINSISLSCNSSCNIIIDGEPMYVASYGGIGMFSLTAQCSSFSIQNPRQSRSEVSCVYSTSVFSNTTLCG